MNGVIDRPLTQKVDFCLLIPCYNNTAGLLASIKTVTYTSPAFLIVVVDDGSTVPVSEAEITGITTGTVKIIRSPRNEGITKSLNKGMAWIAAHVNTLYVARLDCGDKCHKDRFVKQLHFLEQHPDIGLLGSWCGFEDEETGQTFLYTSPDAHKAIIRDMYYRNSFMHASVIMRLSALKQVGFYPLNYEYAEDYALFWLLCKTSSVHILPETLVNCLLNRKGISFRNKNRQLKARLKVVMNLAPNSLHKGLGIFKIACLRVMPKALILRLKIFVNRMQR